MPIIILFFLAQILSNISLKKEHFEHSNQSRIDDILKNYISKEIYQINLRKLKSQMEEDPWIKSAQIILDPPNRIMVKIAEFKPLFLMEQHVSYVDEEGFTVEIGKDLIEDIVEISSGEDDRVYMYRLISKPSKNIYPRLILILLNYLKRTIR